MAIKVSCTCGQSFNAKDELAGKKVRCPKCKNPLKIPDAGFDADDLQLAAPAVVPKYNPLEDILNEEGVKSVSAGPTCPNCSEEIKPGAVICVQCGLNLATGERIRQEEDDDEDDDEDLATAGMTETEKMLYKAEKELEGTPISAEGEKFGDEGDSFIVAIGALVVVGLIAGLGVFAILSLDSIEDFDTVTVSFWMSVLFVIGAQASIMIVAFKEKPLEGWLCLIPAYCEFYAATRGLYMQLGLRVLFMSVAGGCWAAMGGEGS